MGRGEGSRAARAKQRRPQQGRGGLQRLIQALMGTLIDDYSGLLGETDLRKMTDSEFCRDELGLQLGGFPLLRRVEEGRMVSGHGRFWAKVYGGQYYVCSQWWLDHHQENAGALVRFVEGLVNRRAGHPAVPELEGHRAALERYAG